MNEREIEIDRGRERARERERERKRENLFVVDAADVGVHEFPRAQHLEA